MPDRSQAQGNRMKKLCEPQKFSPVSITGGGNQTSGFDAPFAPHRVQADQVEGNLFEHRQIVSSMATAGAHLVVLEDHLYTPVQAVLNRPVRSYRLTETLSIGGQTADVEPLFAGGFP